MTIGAIFRVTFRILRTSLRTLLVLSVLVLAPFYAVFVVFNVRVAELSASMSSIEALSRPVSVRLDEIGELIVWTVVVLVLSIVGGAVASVAFSRVVADRYPTRSRPSEERSPRHAAGSCRRSARHSSTCSRWVV